MFAFYMCGHQLDCHMLPPVNDTHHGFAVSFHLDGTQLRLSDISKRCTELDVKKIRTLLKAAHRRILQKLLDQQRSRFADMDRWFVKLWLLPLAAIAAVTSIAMISIGAKVLVEAYLQE